MIPTTIKTSLRTIAILAALTATVMVKANSNFSVWLDTSTLVGNSAGPYALDFQLNDGAGFGDGSNWATLSNFQFGGGSASGSPSVFGGASGDLSSVVTLTDTSAFNEFYQAFNVGAWLSFDVSLSSNYIVGDTPDFFSFAILDGNLMNLATQSFGSDNFIEINIDSLMPSVATFASTDGLISAQVPDAFNTGIFSAAVLAALVVLKRRRSSGESAALRTDFAVCRVA